MSGTDQQDQELQPRPQPLVEDPELPEDEPNHPGWLSIADIMKISDPVFANSKFLIGYHHSSNVYVLAGNSLTIVDPGNDYTVFTELQALGYDVRDIKKIVLTHGHRDHCMGVFEFLRYPPVWEAKSVEILIHEAGPQEFQKMLRENGFTATRLKGGETIDLSGFAWEVMHTPGHTMDGICLYHPETKTLISGDTVLPDTVADVDPAGGGDLSHYLHAIKGLLRHEIDHILPGHGVPIADNGHNSIELTYEALMMKIIGVTPDSQTTWMEGAALLAEKGLLDEVVYCCDRELALRPGKPSAMRLKAFALNDMGRCEEAITILDRILAEEGASAQILTAKGHALLGLQQYGNSLPYFDQALEIDPELPEAQVFKGMALTFLGRHEEALRIEAFKREFAARFQQEVDKRKQEQAAATGSTAGPGPAQA